MQRIRASNIIGWIDRKKDQCTIFLSIHRHKVQMRGAFGKELEEKRMWKHLWIFHARFAIEQIWTSTRFCAVLGRRSLVWEYPNSSVIYDRSYGVVRESWHVIGWSKWRRKEAHRSRCAGCESSNSVKPSCRWERERSEEEGALIKMVQSLVNNCQSQPRWVCVTQQLRLEKIFSCPRNIKVCIIDFLNEENLCR